MYIMIIGAQGSGKGTQAKLIAEAYQLHHFSSGDALRAEVAKQTPLGKKVEEIMDRGDLVPTELFIELIKQEINNHKGIIFDGFPRTKEQAEYLKGITKIDAVIDLEISDEEAIKRIKSRVITGPDGKPVHRDDDTEEAVKKRLAIYHQSTEPLLAFFEQESIPVLRINGVQTVEEVFSDIKKALSI